MYLNLYRIIEKDAAKAIEELFTLEKCDELLTYISVYTCRISSTGFAYMIPFEYSKVAKKDEKGNTYIDIVSHHMPVLIAV